MKILFAQGNPGNEFTLTRHNVGFYMIDRLAKRHGAEFTHKSKFSADVAECSIEGEKILFVKPTTFYNETGQAARALIDFYKCDPASDFLVIHDELALPFGTVRTRLKASDAGNNGVKSLNAHIGSEHARIRIGVYNDLRTRMPAADFVLAKFSGEEQQALPALFELVEPFVNSFIAGSFEPTKVSL